MIIRKLPLLSRNEANQVLLKFKRDYLVLPLLQNSFSSPHCLLIPMDTPDTLMERLPRKSLSKVKVIHRNEIVSGGQCSGSLFKKIKSSSLEKKSMLSPSMWPVVNLFHMSIIKATVNGYCDDKSFGLPTSSKDNTNSLHV